MRAVVLDPPAEFLERRRRWGADVFDEVWDGVYHAATPLATSGTIGTIAPVREDLRTALGPLAQQAGLHPIAAFNIGEWDENYRVPHMSLHRPQKRSVNWLGLGDGGEYRPIEHSGLIELGPKALAEQIDWP